jgi:predicted Zn-dependent protease
MSYSGIAIFSLVALTAAAQQLTGPALEARFAAREMQWRDETLPVLARQQAMDVDSEARQYVSALGARLSRASSELDGSQCRFVLYDDTAGLHVPGFGLFKRTPHVHALPGGIVLVPRTLFAVTADEAELSAALARGIAHAALRHWMRAMVRSSFSSPWNPLWKPVSKAMLFSRSFESEADRAAIEILSRAGVNPVAVVRYAVNVRASFDTSDTRLEPLRKAISELPRRTYGPDQSLQFETLKSRLAESPESVRL